MSRFPFVVIAFAAALALLGLGGCDSQDNSGRKVVKIASVLPENHPSGQALAFFKKRLEELSGGKMSAQIFYNGKIGDPYATLEQCQNGLLDVTHVSTVNIARMAFMANVLSMPFLWRDLAHQHDVLDGEVGNAIRGELDPYEMSIVAFFDAGTRNITTRKGPVLKPEDLDKMKIRVMDASLMVETVNAFGAQAIPLKQDEVYHALETGLLDGWENNPSTILAFKMYETGCKYCAWTRHSSIPDVLVAGKPFLKALSGQQRKWFDQTVGETTAKQRQLWAESEQEVIKTLGEKGMEFNEVDIESFRSRVKPIYDKYGEEWGPEYAAVLKQIQAQANGATSRPTSAPMAAAH